MDNYHRYLDIALNTCAMKILGKILSSEHISQQNIQTVEYSYIYKYRGLAMRKGRLPKEMWQVKDTDYNP